MKTNKRLVFLAISSELGGAERSLLDLVGVAQKESPHVPLVVLPRQGPLHHYLHDLNIETVFLKLPSLVESLSRKNKISFLLFAIFGLPSYMMYYFRVKNLLSTYNVHSVHSTGIKNHILCCLLTMDTPYHYYIHLRDFITSKLLVTFFSIFSKRKTLHWMAASQAITKNLNWHIPIFYDGLSESVFYRNPTDALKKQLGLNPTATLIGHAAALTPWKGQMIFIEAASEILKTRKDLHFVIIGSPIYKTNHFKNYDVDLKNKVKDLGIESHVHFVPFIKNSREIYDGLDLFVHSSLQPEPFGRVILEALFCEKPVVAAGAGGVLEIMRGDAAREFLHTPGDASSLVRTIENALTFKHNHLEDLIQDVKSRFQMTSCYKRQVDYLSESH